MNKLVTDRTYLHERHRLSHQQIDFWLEENTRNEFLQEKLNLLEFVGYFLSVTDILRQNNISFIPIKGPLLSYRIYKDPAVRFSKDIDILIEMEMVETVVKILLNNGFCFENGVLWPKNITQQELIFEKSNHLCFYNIHNKYIVEIHWTLMQVLPVSQSKLKSMVAENLVEEDFAGRKFTCLNKEFELLFLLIHGAKHGWSRFKWLMDIKDYPMKDVSEAKFKELAVKFKAGRIIAQVNFLLHEYFNTNFPFKGYHHFPPFLINLTHKSIASNISDKPPIKDIIYNYLYLMLLFKGLYYKIEVLSGSLFRPVDIANVDSSLRIVYYLYRPVGFIKRRLK